MRRLSYCEFVCGEARLRGRHCVDVRATAAVHLESNLKVSGRVSINNTLHMVKESFNK